MSELDFQKIFASGASSQIDWTDDNYLKGWGYLGNVPPSYQSFDSLQRLNDLKFKYLYDEFMGIETNTEELISNHNENSEAHKTLFDKKLDKNGGTVTGNLNASGYNITATKFIGNLQGNADSAANADLATKANQDSQGQVINTTYVKGVTASNATLTVTKGNGTTSTVTINNVENSKKATQDSQGQAINTTYIKGVTNSNATLTITKGDGTTSTVTVTNVDRALNSVKATQDSAGNVIGNTYVKNTGSNNMSGFFGLDTACGLGIMPNYMGFFDSTNTTYVLRHNTGDNYVTAITPPTNDNSTKLATTAFVKSLFTASKQDNGWWKDGNTGLIYQWRKKQTDGNSNGFYSNFPITFPNALLLVIPTDCVENQTEGNLSYVAWGPDSSDTSKVYLKVNSGNNIYSYLAIGY